jgi:hypothetical protein
LASTVSEATLLVASEHQAFGDEERLQQPGRVSRAAAGPTAVRHGRDQRSGTLDACVQRALEPAQMSQADRRCLAVKQPVGERAEPWRALLTESILRALDPDADDQRVALIARAAEPMRGVAADVTAAPTLSGGGLFGWGLTANAPPAAWS